MYKKLILLLIFQFYFHTSSHSQNIETPIGYDIIIKITGDLDKDGVSETVIVYNTDKSTALGVIREIQILKKINEKWNLWKSSRNSILKSEEGGIMGDPFEGIKIKNGILLISHSGGSSWKWSYTDKYRFQNNEFELIGHSSIYGKLCEYWQNFDFNISTGKIILKKEYENCENQAQEIFRKENEIFYKKGIDYDLNNRYLKDSKIVSPKYKHNIYL